MIIHFELCYSHASDVRYDGFRGFPFPENMTHLNLDYMFVPPPRVQGSSYIIYIDNVIFAYHVIIIIYLMILFY